MLHYASEQQTRVKTRLESKIKLRGIDKAQEFDVGELLVCSIAKDGMKNGYDYKLYKKIVDYTQKPIIAIGGAGSASHIVNLFKSSDVDAAAIGNVLYFNEHSTSKIKSRVNDH